jgi:Relaxase/Mobilisation nuclease domain
MIIKGMARGRARQLAAHLLRSDQNESVQLYETRGTLASDVEGALEELEARGRAGRSKAPLYHASVSPEAAFPLRGEQIRQAVDLLEEKLGFRGQPRIVVLHRKDEREHVHVVWSRVSAETGRAISTSWNYRIHEAVSRELEARFGHPAIQNSRPRPQRPSGRQPLRDHEVHQFQRSGSNADAVASELTGLWQESETGEQFRKRLEEAGYILARGDRRSFVVIDRAGTVHSLTRRLRGTGAELKEKLGATDLPSVAQARSTQKMAQPERGLARRLASTFKDAAKEITRARRGPLPRKRSPKRQTGTFRSNRSYVVGAPQGGSQSGTAIFPSPLVYRSKRAALIADFARRIANVFRNLPPDEIRAAIEALHSEREAALQALRLTETLFRQIVQKGRKPRRRTGKWKVRLCLRRRGDPR